MTSAKSMIQSPTRQDRDRLEAFFEAFSVSTSPGNSGATGSETTLSLVGHDGDVAGIVLDTTRREAGPAELLLEVAIDFGGAANPLLSALPARFVVDLDDQPVLRTIASAFLAEAKGQRCGRQVAVDRLCEVVLLLVLRLAIERGDSRPGLLAGLAEGGSGGYLRHVAQHLHGHVSESRRRHAGRVSAVMADRVGAARPAARRSRQVRGTAFRVFKPRGVFARLRETVRPCAERGARKGHGRSWLNKRRVGLPYAPSQKSRGVDRRPLARRSRTQQDRNRSSAASRRIGSKRARSSSLEPALPHSNVPAKPGEWMLRSSPQATSTIASPCAPAKSSRIGLRRNRRERSLPTSAT